MGKKYTFKENEGTWYLDQWKIIHFPFTNTPLNIKISFSPSFFKVSPALVDELPISHTSTTDFVELIISFDLLETSFKGILIEAVI